MRKGTRPCKHVRKVRTKRGKKQIVINRNIKKKGRVSRQNRKLFNHINQRPVELGGYMDFNEKGLENVNLFFGGKSDIFLPESPDYELTWHTHPASKNKVLDRANHFPSPEDAEGFLYEDLAQQAMIIFHKNSAAIITKTPKTKRLLRSLPKHEIKKRLVKVEQAILELSNRPNITNKAALLQPVYETLGLRLTFVKPKQALNIPIKVRN